MLTNFVNTIDYIVSIVVVISHRIVLYKIEVKNRKQ